VLVTYGKSSIGFILVLYGVTGNMYPDTRNIFEKYRLFNVAIVGDSMP